MTDKTSLMEFPCDFPIKVIGKNSATFAIDVANVARKHFPDILDSSICIKPSNQDKYLAITVTVYAQNQKTLDALYLELTKLPDIKMVL